MNPTFNLLDNPWIPSVDRENRAVMLNLRETLLQAHRLRELAGESPLVTASLYRLLLAILHRVFGPQDEETWFDLWNAGQFPTGPLEDYLRQWHHRFDLFDVERPFFQIDDDRVKTKSVISMIQEVASGNNATLFDHHTKETGMTLSPAQAARFLIAAQSFALGGGKSGISQNFTDAPWARGVIFLVEGNRLFETLLLNLSRYPEEILTPFSKQDAPFWEQDDPTLHRVMPLGYVDYLTWPARRILLIPEKINQRIVIRKMKFTQGLVLNRDIQDPVKLYIAKNKNKAPSPLKFREERALWRDSVALFKLRDQGFRPPRTFAWLSHLIEYDFECGKGELKPGLRRRYMALGMATDPKKRAKVNFCRAEYNPLPLEYLTNPVLVGRLDESLKMTEDVRNQLWGAARTLATYIISPQADAEGARKPDPKDLENLTARWAIDRDYWGQLEIPFRLLIEKLPDDVEGTLERWQQTLRRTAWTAFDRVANDLEHDPRNLKATIKAREQLAAGLGKVLPQ